MKGERLGSVKSAVARLVSQGVSSLVKGWAKKQGSGFMTSWKRLNAQQWGSKLRNS